MGGGTRMAGGMQYFKDNYGPSAILILISDFEDYLEEWHKVEETMKGYTMYGFNYGSRKYDQKFTYFKVKNFTDSRYD
jgi:nicotinic acid mononucleotide adenylyltransferase